VAARVSRRASLLLLLAAAVVAALTYPWWLAGMGHYLVRASQPEPADIAVVLGGDSYGHRILKAGELVRAGYVPRVLVSGAPGYYGFHECELAIPFAVKKGYPEDWFIHFEHDANSTEEEARYVIPELKRRGVRRFLMVTTDYHTRRARSVFERTLGDLKMTVVAAPDEFFRADSWWKRRPARKIAAMEWTKTVAWWIGL
jgi:uncharacterized SAM-binding protein YcdF (DUF218 family)